MRHRDIAKALNIALTQLRARHDLRRECLSRMFSPPRSCQSAARDQQLVPSGIERDAHDLERVRIE